MPRTSMRKRAAIVCLLLALTGCAAGGSDVPLWDTLAVEEEAGTAEAPTESVGVYVDTTPSMQGFVTRKDGEEGAANYYVTCLDEIDKMLALDYDPEDICYYRVDTPLWEVPENALKEAMEASYYVSSDSLEGRRGYERAKSAEGSGYASPCLSAALKEGKAQDLFILITDFYENDAQTSVLLEAIKETALDDGEKVFGLVGVRAGFRGKIYDSGADGKTVDYGMDEDAYRPFYVIVRGYPETVADFCGRLKERLNAPDGACESSVFYQETFTGLDYRDFGGCESYWKGFLWYNGLTVAVNASAELPVFEYQKADGEREALFSYSVPKARQEEFHRLADEIGTPEAVDLGTGEQELERLNCLTLNPSAARWSAEESSFVTADGGGDLFEIGRVYYDRASETLYVGLRLAEERLQAGIWRLQWQTAADTETDELPWWREWNCENGTWDYSKTERLNDYVDAMTKTLSQAEQCVLSGAVYLNVEG